MNLALSLAAGKGCAKNETASAKWFEAAADKGDVRAQRMIGTPCESSLGDSSLHGMSSKLRAPQMNAYRLISVNSEFIRGIQMMSEYF